MITNFPRVFPIEQLEDWDFGSADANQDSLLRACPCRLKATSEFLGGSKDIVLGERGTGKTALFRMLCNGDAQFDSSRRKQTRQQFVIPIEDELQYSALRNVFNESVRGKGLDKATKFRFIWEIFLVQRIVEALLERLPDNKELLKIHEELSVGLGLEEKKATILQLLVTHKKTVGMKLEGMHAGLTVPNFYTSVEPSANVAPATKDGANIVVGIDSIKKRLSEVLKANNAIAYVLIDCLDEFVVREDYETQKDVIQALLVCQRRYQTYSRVKIRLFLRTDLFKRLDFGGLGYDKVTSRTVELRWSPQDIRELIAKRVFLNLANSLGLSHLDLRIEEQLLRINRKALKEVSGLGGTLPKSAWIVRRTKQAYWTFLSWLQLVRLDLRDARKTNFNDEVNQQVITAVFPTKIKHRSGRGGTEDIQLFEYLDTHFQLASGATTPRIVLMYLGACLEHVRDYYRQNDDTANVQLDKHNEYPLVLRDCMQRAYEDARSLVWETMTRVEERWKKPISLFRDSRSTLDRKFGYDSLRELLLPALDNEMELQHLVAFLCHMGVLREINHHAEYRRREYELPLILR